MHRSSVIAVAVVAVLMSIPVAAQQQVWSATLTAGTLTRGSLTYYGYRNVPGASGEFELSDPDFEYGGETYTFIYIMSLSTRPPNQPDDVGDASGPFINVFLEPPLYDPNLTFTFNGHAFAVADSDFMRENRGGTGLQIRWNNPGIEWTDGQSVAVALTAPTSTPALQPLAAAGLLAMMLGVGANGRTVSLSPLR